MVEGPVENIFTDCIGAAAMYGADLIFVLFAELYFKIWHGVQSTVLFVLSSELSSLQGFVNS